jgi:tripartite-type tricarboxylate transporter receptor subunit TctC
MQGTFRALFALALPLALLAAQPARGQEYPNRPVRFIVGPGPDVLARLIAQKMSDALGKQFYVEPLPGAGGIVAAQTVAKSAPDGHTLLLTTGSYSIMQALNPNLPFNLLKDFEPVALLGTLSFVLVANPAVPVKSLNDLLELARSRPGKINCASSGRGTTAHLGCEMLKTFGKVDIVHVPYNGASAALNDLVGKHVDIMFLTVPQGAEYVRSGQLRGLAVTGPNRSAALPDTPTVGEAGLAPLQFVSWNGVHIAANTPAPIVTKLNAELDKTLQLPDVRQRMGTLGLEPRGGSAAQFAEFMKADTAQWAKVVKETGVKTE